jgi:hypothetical protein
LIFFIFNHLFFFLNSILFFRRRVIETFMEFFFNKLGFFLDKINFILDLFSYLLLIFIMELLRIFGVSRIFVIKWLYFISRIDVDFFSFFKSFFSIRFIIKLIRSKWILSRRVRVAIILFDISKFFNNSIFF